jgi:hypothetical protein
MLDIPILRYVCVGAMIAVGFWPLAILVVIAKLLSEHRTFQTCTGSAALMLGPLRPVTTARFATFAIGLLRLPCAAGFGLPSKAIAATPRRSLSAI